jgi:hypothetical protein
MVACGGHLTAGACSPPSGVSWFTAVGFEFMLAPYGVDGTLYLQLLDQAGLPLSDNIYIIRTMIARGIWCWCGSRKTGDRN